MSENKRLFIVEDQRLVAADLEKTLSKAGYEVVGNVATGEEAVPKILELAPDLVLMDVKLAGKMDGIDAARAVRERADIPIVYLTAYADEETIVRARGTAAFGYLVKPFNERELQAAIEIALYRREMDRVLAEERARRQVAEETKLLVQGVKDYAIYMLDPRGRVASWNEGAERISGFSWNDVVGAHASLFDPAGSTHERELLETALREGRAEHEGWRLRKDGSRYWASVTVTPIRDAEGNFHGFGEIVRDLTERRQTSEQIRLSEERLRLLVENVRDYAIIMLDPGGNVTTWNQGATRLYGYETSEIVGQRFSKLYAPDALHALHPERELEVAARDGRYSEEGWRMRKDGTRFWADVTMTPLEQEGELVGFAKITRDLTERRRRDEALRGSEERLHALAEASRVLAESLDPNATLEALSKVVVPKIADWYAVDLLQADGSLEPVAIAHSDPAAVERGRDLRRRYPLDPNASTGVPNVIRTGRSELYGSITDELLRQGSVDEEHYQRLQALHVRSAMIVPLATRGRVLGAMTLVASTDGRYTEHDLLFAEELGRRAAVAVENARLYRESTEAVARAQEAVRARDEFLQIASHELKTPLTPLQLQLDTLDRELSKETHGDGHLKRKVATAARQTARLGGLVDRLLDVSRVTSGRIVLDLEELELGQLLRDVAERFRDEAEAAGVELQVDLDGSLRGRWDRLRLEQVFSNLISNGIKYGRGRPVEVRAERAGDVIRVSVTDRGIGIDARARDRIFGRFERAVSVRHFGGLGLGLFIARHFTEAHGGVILVESQPDVGSVFTVMLPLGVAQPGAQSSEPRERAS